MTLNDIILCPICNSDTERINKLDSFYIKNKLLIHFNTELIDKTELINNLEIIDYNLMKCNACSFEFSYPKTEGSNSFYNWVTSMPDYYTTSRWEYSKVLELLSKDKSLKLLDVGCGDGRFFDKIVLSNNNIDFYGLDTTQSSVDTCNKKGYKVFCMDIEKFKTEYKGYHFDAITLYHVLEHISNPKEFLCELVSLINPSGAIYISTPYSPMDFEVQWFDVLNHPPHHMGRWNLESYTKLAEVTNLKIDIFMPESIKLIKSTIQSFQFSLFGTQKMITKLNILKKIILHPLKFSLHLYKQFKRDKVNGKRAANVILVRFSKK